MQVIMDREKWIRCKGIRSDCYALIDEVQEWIVELNRQLNFTLLSVRAVSDGKKVVSVSIQAIEPLHIKGQNAEKGAHEFYLVTPEFPYQEIPRDYLASARLNLGGAVAMIAASHMHKKKSCSFAAVNTEVMNIETKERVQYTDGIVIYRKLKSIIKRETVYYAAQVFPDGTVVDNKYIFFTERAARAQERGEIEFDQKPGSRIRQQ